MKVEVILGQVGEDRDGEVDRVGAVQRERVRGDLDRACSVAPVEHLAECALQIDRLGRRALHLALDAADHALDGPQQAGLASAGLEQRSDQERGRRLAVGPRHADRLQARGRIAVERRRRGRHRGAHVRAR